MPYREAPRVALCHQCERHANNTCFCCVRPSCDRHFLVDKRMCGTCDEALYRFHHREDAGGVGRQMLVIAGLASIPAMITMALLPLTVGIVFVGMLGMFWYRSRADRRKFLHMMRTRGALAPAEPAFTEQELALQKYEAKIDDRRAVVHEPDG